MDLRGILNDNGPAATTPSKPPPPPPMMMPLTPVQTNPHQPFRDYSQTHPSPSARHMSIDYSLQQAPPSAYASPPPYPSTGPYPTRPAQPPPLQQVSANDLRSPSIAGPGPSPYRQTPTSSISASSGGGGGGYPFPSQPSSTSPVQQHRYPPQGPYHRDSFPQPSLPGGMTGPPGGVSYMQAGPQVPQTPPVVTPGGHSYPHQRSQSTHSTSTPTSAHSQQAQYGGAPFLQGSPVATHHSLPHMEPPAHVRHVSQPPTPVAAPLNRPAQTMSYGQPPSPYQQRLPTAATYPPHPPSQTSPPQPQPPSLPRHSSTAAAYDPVAHEAHRRSQSRGDRERSLSVSPKTRVPSLPGSASRPGTSVSDVDPRRPSNHPSITMPSAMDHERERAVTPAKRKLDDRELRPDELEKREVRPPPFENTNGRSTQIDAAPLPQSHANAPRKPLKKRRVYSTPPVWATALQGRRPTQPSVTIYRPPQHAAQAVNGNPDVPTSRHTSPEERRAMPAPHTAAAPPPQPAVPEPAPPADPALPPWEPSITGIMPRDAMSKVVADFLFQYVVCHPAMGEMQSRKVQFEIEAKLGTLIDKSTSQRISLPCISECVVTDQGNWLGFRSSMSEDYHRSFNSFLNNMVQEAHPGNKDRRKPRMPIEYRHRREIDKFFELPDRERTRMLPACVANEIASRNHHAKVRVTHDQKTDEVLAKIVKARVADLNLHFPEFPLDCRISVNLEMEWDGSLEELDRLSSSANRQPQPNRGKDRLSYIHGPYQIDLTQVTHSSQGPNNTQRMEKEHEIEIEVNPLAILENGRRAADGQPNHYPELVEGLINNVRVLAKKALEFSQAQGR